MGQLDLLTSPALRGVGLLATGISERKLAEAAADRVLAIAEDDARLRALQGAQLLAQQRVARAKQRVSGPTDLDLAVTTAELEAADVERFRFAGRAQADQTRRGGRAALFGRALGLSTVFLDAAEARRKQRQNQELRREIQRVTAIATGLPSMREAS